MSLFPTASGNPERLSHRDPAAGETSTVANRTNDALNISTRYYLPKYGRLDV
jgi:hypothetical protein